MVDKRDVIGTPIVNVTPIRRKPVAIKLDSSTREPEIGVAPEALIPRHKRQDQESEPKTHPHGQHGTWHDK